MMSKELIDQLRKMAQELAEEAKGSEHEAHVAGLQHQINDDLDTLEKRQGRDNKAP